MTQQPANNIHDPEYVRELFNEMAKTYDRVNYITSFGFSLQWRKQFIHKIERTNTEVKVLDLMTGMGETWGVLRHQFPAAKIDALDYSDVMIEKAGHKLIQSGIKNLHLIHDNILESKISDSSYDVITCAFGLKTFDTNQIEQLAVVVNRILKPGGKISFIEISVPSNKILRALYGFYTGRIIPFIGKLFLGNPDNYKMLWKYTVRFRNCNQAAEIFRSKGFDIAEEKYFWGCSTGFTGTKK